MTDRAPAHSNPPPLAPPGVEQRAVSRPHIWVTYWGVDILPALLCSWRRGTDGTWEGLVVAAFTYGTNNDPSIRQGWVPAHHIHQSKPGTTSCAVDDHLHRA
jgi:hypothetical protein